VLYKAVAGHGVQREHVKATATEQTLHMRIVIRMMILNFLMYHFDVYIIINVIIKINVKKTKYLIVSIQNPFHFSYLQLVAIGYGMCVCACVYLLLVAPGGGVGAQLGVVGAAVTLLTAVGVAEASVGGLGGRRGLVTARQTLSCVHACECGVTESWSWC
jgi:hypothetical protein